MRRYIGSIVLGITLCAAPLAAAPSANDGEEAVRPPVEHQGFLPAGFPDEAAMVLAGSLLIGAAAAVRRAV